MSDSQVIILDTALGRRAGTRVLDEHVEKLEMGGSSRRRR